MHKILVFALLTHISLAAAQENFSSHPAAVYPPGCATLTAVADAIDPGDSEPVADGEILLLDPEDQQPSAVSVVVYRQGCAEPGRAVIKVAFEVVSGGKAPVPLVEAQIGAQIYPLRLAADPNSFEETNAWRMMFSGQLYEFFLEGPSWSDLQNPDVSLPVISPEQYNGAFGLRFVDVVDFSESTAQLPAYDGSLQADAIALNGRLSGTWVVADVPDQGFLLAFEELADGENFLFLSWYTYGADGELLWLTGGDRYEIGASEIALNLDLVTNGEFLGPKTADRAMAGTASLAAVDCNKLQFSYDLTSLELGSGTVTLKRLFSLETAGYACRDRAAREATAGD